MNFLTALVAGLLFGTGLLVSGMTNPQTVLGFLDVAGEWNPALACTMAGALLVAMPTYRWVRRRARTLTGQPVELPDRCGLTAGLLAGAATFGVGWGMSGICPGPALVLLASGTQPAFVFFGAMLAGMYLARAPVFGRRPAGAAAVSPEQAT